MELVVFYSWQSDQPQDLCRYFIRECAEEALRQLSSGGRVDPAPRLDHDTKGQAGMPEIAQTILAKIEGAALFLGDVTYVGRSDANDAPKSLPNPNVMLELGYAARAIGWHRIICVMNEAFGPRDDQIFNIRHRRAPIAYSLSDPGQRAVVKPTLIARMKEAVAALQWTEHLAVVDVLAGLDLASNQFMALYARDDRVIPPALNVSSWGAPAGALDTPSYQAAVSRLLDRRLLSSRFNPAEGVSWYEWTYLGALVLQHLGLRPKR